MLNFIVQLAGAEREKVLAWGREYTRAWELRNPERRRATAAAAKARYLEASLLARSVRLAQIEAEQPRPLTWGSAVWAVISAACNADLEKSRQQSRRVPLARRRALKQAWKQANPDQHRKHKAAWRKARRAQRRPVDRLLSALRGRLHNAVLQQGARRAGRTLQLLGCTAEFLRAHLEARFRPGMTWDNYGPIWHIDHIKPCAKFDLTDPEQQRACFHFTNLQPLFAMENCLKGAKYDDAA